jgi:hypothetical protein
LTTIIKIGYCLFMNNANAPMTPADDYLRFAGLDAVVNIPAARKFFGSLTRANNGCGVLGEHAVVARDKFGRLISCGSLETATRRHFIN